MTTGTDTPQVTLAKYLHGEISLEAAAALVAAIAARRTGAGHLRDLVLHKPAGATLSADDYARVDALMAEVDHQVSER